MNPLPHDWLLLAEFDPDAEEELQRQWWQAENEDEDWILTYDEEQQDGYVDLRGL